MTPLLARVLEEDRDELTEEEAREYLDSQTRLYLDLSLDEFYARAEEGTLPEHPMVAHLVLLSGARANSC